MSCSELSRTYCILASRHCFHNGPMSCCSVIHSLYRREHRKTWSLKRRWSLVNPNSRKVKAAKDHLRGRRKGCGHMGSGRQSQMRLMMPMLQSLPGMSLSCLEAQDELLCAHAHVCKCLRTTMYTIRLIRRAASFSCTMYSMLISLLLAPALWSY